MRHQVSAEKRAAWSVAPLLGDYPTGAAWLEAVDAWWREHRVVLGGKAPPPIQLPMPRADYAALAAGDFPLGDEVEPEPTEDGVIDPREACNP